VTFTEETGVRIMPERIRKGAEAMERAGFVLQYECPLAASEEERRIYREYWTASAELYLWYTANYVLGIPISGEQGRIYD